MRDDNVCKGILVPGLPHPLLCPEKNEGWQKVRDAYDKAMGQFNIEQDRGRGVQEDINRYGLAAVQKAADLIGDRVWQLPSFPEYGESIKGKYGDLQNIGVGDSGTIIGGMFLEHFVNNTPWVHLDIAGTAWNVKHIGYQPDSGATGFGVRLLTDLVQNWEPIK